MVSLSALVTILIYLNTVTPIFTQQQKWYDLSDIFDSIFDQETTTESHEADTTVKSQHSVVQNNIKPFFNPALVQKTTTESYVDTTVKVEVSTVENITKLDEKIKSIESTISSLKNKMMKEITEQKTQNYQNYDDMNVNSAEDVNENKIGNEKKCLNSENAAQLNEVYEELMTNYVKKIDELEKIVTKTEVCNCHESTSELPETTSTTKNYNFISTSTSIGMSLANTKFLTNRFRFKSRNN